MKQSVQKWMSFWGKSMVWSLLLYVALMLVANWDEVSNTMSGRNKITIVNSAQPAMPQPAPNAPSSVTPGRTGVIKNVMTLVKTISGISRHSASI